MANRAADLVPAGLNGRRVDRGGAPAVSAVVAHRIRSWSQLPGVHSSRRDDRAVERCWGVYPDQLDIPRSARYRTDRGARAGVRAVGPGQRTANGRLAAYVLAPHVGETARDVGPRIPVNDVMPLCHGGFASDVADVRRRPYSEGVVARVEKRSPTSPQIGRRGRSRLRYSGQRGRSHQTAQADYREDDHRHGVRALRRSGQLGDEDGPGNRGPER